MRRFPTGTVLPAPGSRVEAVLWAASEVIDDNVTVPPGTQGTVSGLVDDLQIGVTWDNGARLQLVPGDAWKPVP
jgi:hypothetical protein